MAKSPRIVFLVSCVSAPMLYVWRSKKKKSTAVSKVVAVLCVCYMNTIWFQTCSTVAQTYLYTLYHQLTLDFS